MLNELINELDTIEARDEWAANFIADIDGRVTDNPNYKLSGKQFDKLNQLHQKYVLNWR